MGVRTLHRLTRRAASRAALAAMLLCVSGSLGLPAWADASVSWSGAIAIDRQAQGVPLNRLACPSTSQCTAVDGQGHAVTFDPQSPKTVISAVVTTHDPTAIACPSITQCTVVDVSGDASTFDPESSAGATPVQIDAGAIPISLACPSTTQCTLVDVNGQALTFNPQALNTAPRPISLDPNHVLISVQCPGASTTWCVAVDTSGRALAFDPTGHYSAQPPVQIDSSTSNSVQAAACSPVSDQCALVDNAANGVAFTAPSRQAPAPGSSGTAEYGPNAAVPTALSCPADGTCVAVDGHGSESTFDPQSLLIGVAVPVDKGQTLADVACPSATQCTAVDRAGQEVTFNPSSPSGAVPVPIDGHTTLGALACPTADRCTAVDLGGSEVTFTPGSFPQAHTAVVDPGASGLYALSCPGSSQCTTVDDAGREVTFNPAAPGTPAPVTMVAGHALYGVSCPSIGQCTAVDDAGQAITFDPQAPAGRRTATIDAGHVLLAVACPLLTQCTAIDDAGAEVTFDPRARHRSLPHAIDRVFANALACPLPTQCTAVDGHGDEVTFDPRAPGRASALAIDPGHELDALACRSGTDCVALDLSGRALEGDPHSRRAWTARRISDAPLAAVQCPSVSECVAVDQPGDAFVGTAGALAPRPRLLRAPGIFGRAVRGGVLRAGHGRWSHALAAFSYQWLRCNRAGRRCRAIPRATGVRYRLGWADVGHRLRVRVLARNATGGVLALSRPSAVVGSGGARARRALA